MNSEEDEPSGSRFVRAWVRVEDRVQNAKVTYPVRSVTLVAEGNRTHRFAATYHHIKIDDTDFVAHSLRELTAILREHFSDSPLHWELCIERDQKAEAARQARIDQLARALARAGAKTYLRRSR